MKYLSQPLRRHLYEQSAVFNRVAHALVAAADQLNGAHCRDYAKTAEDVRNATLVAIHAALSAHQLVGSYELAAWLESRRGGTVP